MKAAKDSLLKLYESMQRLRKFEEEVSVQFANGNVPGFVHLYIGQEAVAVGACSSLRP
ncbi:MAG: hypothetical protein C4520_10895, partial [Candidatus Abyssobacteria bacterium SURF_5]